MEQLLDAVEVIWMHGAGIKWIGIANVTDLLHNGASPCGRLHSHTDEAWLMTGYSGKKMAEWILKELQKRTTRCLHHPCTIKGGPLR